MTVGATADAQLDDWIQCPHCGTDGSASIASDLEHVMVACEHCGAAMKLYKGHLSDFPSP